MTALSPRLLAGCIVALFVPQMALAQSNSKPDVRVVSLRSGAFVPAPARPPGGV